MTNAIKKVGSAIGSVLTPVQSKMKQLAPLEQPSGINNAGTTSTQNMPNFIGQFGANITAQKKAEQDLIRKALKRGSQKLAIDTTVLGG